MIPTFYTHAEYKVTMLLVLLQLNNDTPKVNFTVLVYYQTSHRPQALKPAFALLGMENFMLFNVKACCLCHLSFTYLLTLIWHIIADVSFSVVPNSLYGVEI